MYEEASWQVADDYDVVTLREARLRIRRGDRGDGEYIPVGTCRHERRPRLPKSLA